MIVKDEMDIYPATQGRFEPLVDSVSAILHDGREILDEVHKVHPDLILMNIHHGGFMNGLSVAQEVHQALGTPIICLADLSDNEFFYPGCPSDQAICRLSPTGDRSLLANIERAFPDMLLDPGVKEREAHCCALIENSTDIITIMDGSGTIHFSSPLIRDVLGYTVDEALGNSLMAFIHPDDRDEVTKNIQNLLNANPGFSNIRFRAIHKDGGFKVMEGRTSLLLNSPQCQRVLFSSRDITEQIEMEQSILKERDQARKILDTAHVLLITLDDRGMIAMINTFALRLLGYEEEEVLGKNWFDLFLPEDTREEIRGLHLKTIRDDLLLAPENTYAVRTKSGEPRYISWHNIVLTRTGQHINTILSTGEDITEWKLAEERLQYNAEHDSLTGLPNRAAFLSRLKGAIDRVIQHPGDRFAVLYLDLDSFKLINDSFGHPFGDRYLVATARRLESIINQRDTIARFSGDEFYILVDDISDLDEAIHLAEKIQKELNTPILLDGQSISISCSVGIVIGSKQTKYIDEILRDADIAMYQAKSRGKAGFSFFVPAMRTLPLARLKLENELRQALEKNEFKVVYQPIISLADQRISGFEALLRWERSDGREILPAEFIPVLEETGLIIQVGEWVLWQTCSQLKNWQEQYDLDKNTTISVNISVRQLTSPSFVNQVIHAVTTSGIQTQNLILELTESIFLMDTEFARSLLLRLHDLGVHTHIDDFGTGYSSLKYLQTLPFDAIKIDRSFIQDLNSKSKRKEIIHSIIELGKMVGVNTIAEGVETDEQYNSLIDIGCTHAQGFLISKPMASEKVPTWIENQQESAGLSRINAETVKFPAKPTKRQLL